MLKPVFPSPDYEEYPVLSFRHGSFEITLEGRIYGLDIKILRNDLIDLADKLLAASPVCAEPIAEWLMQHDGDFVIVVHESQSGQWFILNDILGRLPLYFWQTADELILSREIGFVVSRTRSSGLDKTAISQYLLFGYCLGGRTLYSNVRRFPPATLLHVDTCAGNWGMQTVHQLDTETEKREVSSADICDHLVSTLKSACSKQTDRDRKNIISLSGGLDSRAVAAGLRDVGVPLVALTFEDSLGQATLDAAVAEETAKALNIQWHGVRLPTQTGRNASRVLDQKWGIISLGMAFDAPFMDEIKRLHGRSITYFSGDGGDKLLPNHLPSSRFFSVRSLAIHVVERNCVMPPKIVSELTGISIRSFVDEVQRVLESYPEQSLRQRYVHFMIAERAMNWLFEGEDRNRCMFWSCTPFYSLPFFRAAMSCPDKLKRGHRLYRDFLVKLSPETAGIVHANRGTAITSPQYERKIRLISLLWRYPRLTRRIRIILHRGGCVAANSTLLQCFRKQLRDCETIGDYLDAPSLMQLADNPQPLNRETFENLLTITTMIERLNNSSDSLSDFFDAEFV